MNAFELAAKISLDKKGFDDGLNKAESRMSKFASGVKNVLGTVAKVGTAAIAAGGSAFVALTKQAFNAAADYEQLVGGVETLFKGAAGKVEQYANEAYKTAGVSANQYMETVTGFSASLLQSLGGDVDKAADIANMALVDMSDNANKMGTDMSSIQTAYQGFAKQNYTMLDNLKLGYGGTRTEMERLLKDASALSGVKYDISSLSDVYNAIHVIQTELNITGTTAKEASTTISGSWGMVKAAFGNFLSGGGAYAYKDLSESLNNALDISIDRLSRIVPRLITQGREVLKSVSGKLPKLMETLMPGVEAGLEALLSTISDILPFLLETGARLVPSIIKGIGTVFVKIGKKAPEILKGLFDGIKGAAKTIGGAIFGMDGENVKWPTWEDVKGYAIAAWNGIKDGARKIADFAGGLIFGRKEDGTIDWPTWDDVKAGAKAAWNFIKDKAKTLSTEFGKLIFGTNEKGEVKWPTWDEVQQAAIDTWNDIKDKAKTLVTGAGKIIFGENENGEVKWPENITEIAETAKTWWNDKVKPQLKGAFDFVMDMFGLPDSTELGTKISQWWASAKSSIGNLFDSIFYVPGANEIIESLRGSVNSVIGWINKTFGTSLGKIGEDVIDLSADALSDVTRKQSQAEHFIDRLEELINTYGDNATFTKIYQDTVQQLIMLFPELGKNFDAQTGKILSSTAALRENLEEQIAVAKQQALSSAMTEQDAKLAAAAKAKLDAQIRYNEAIEAEKAQQEEMLELYNRLINSSWIQANIAGAKEGGWILSDDDVNNAERVTEAVSGLFGFMQQAYSGFGAGGNVGMAKALGVSMDELWGMSGVIDQYDAVKKEVDDAKEAIEDADAKMDDAKQKYESYARALKSVMDEATNAINEAKNALESMPSSKTIDVKMNMNGIAFDMDVMGFNLDGQHANGLSFVPENDYLASLHFGEAVLSRNEAEKWRKGQSGDSGAVDLSSLTNAIVAAVKRGMESANITMDGESVTRNVSRRQAEDVMARRFATV